MRTNMISSVKAHVLGRGLAFHVHLWSCTGLKDKDLPLPLGRLMATRPEYWPYP